MKLHHAALVVFNIGHSVYAAATRAPPSIR